MYCVGRPNLLPQSLPCQSPLQREGSPRDKPLDFGRSRTNIQPELALEWNFGEAQVEISRGISFRFVDREIARGLQRAASTVSREVARLGGRLLYRASEADQQAWKLAMRPKACLLARHRKLREIVASKLILDWSPEQISGWLKRRYPGSESMCMSHETIYRSLFIQARGVLKKELMQHLRSKRLIRRSQHARAGGKSPGQIVRAISIRERPAEIEDRAIPGHWEGDLLSGTANSHIATLVERHSRFTILVKVPSKDTATVVVALTRQVRKLPASLRRSLTWDRGHEMAKHKSFTVATKVNVYFCDPQSPWQRATNENTNGLLRQYFPRKTDLSGYSQADLDKVALRFNGALIDSNWISIDTRFSSCGGASAGYT